MLPAIPHSFEQGDDSKVQGIRFGIRNTRKLNLKEKVCSQFEQFFGTEAIMVFAPGRINILGEHIDYNDGIVLPAAIDKRIYLAIGTAEGKTHNLHALDFDEQISIDVSPELEPSQTLWANYLLGVIQGFTSRGIEVPPLNVVFAGDIPSGSGLSSSAALESSMAFAMNHLLGTGLTRKEMALIGQKAEHDFVGVQCGIMDQFASCLTREGHILELDCQTQEIAHIPANFKDHELVLIDSCVKHSLAESAYNRRREDAAKGLKILQSEESSIRSFRDLDLDMLARNKHQVPARAFQRCSFVVNEMARVKKAVPALRAGDMSLLGELMYETHEGLSKDYEVSCDELDVLVDLAKKNGLTGSRMMGGGFGGCTLNLLPMADESAIKNIVKDYQKTTGIVPKVYKVKTGPGADILD